MTFLYKTSGTCARSIEFEIENDVLVSVRFEGGCNGNLKGIAALCKGMKVDDVIERLKGLTCGFKSTSCTDQLTRALLKYKEK